LALPTDQRDGALRGAFADYVATGESIDSGGQSHPLWWQQLLRVSRSAETKVARWGMLKFGPKFDPASRSFWCVSIRSQTQKPCRRLWAANIDLKKTRRTNMSPRSRLTSFTLVELPTEELERPALAPKGCSVQTSEGPLATEPSWRDLARCRTVGVCQIQTHAAQLATLTHV
jgi:hypothetical protein